MAICYNLGMTLPETPLAAAPAEQNPQAAAEQRKMMIGLATGLILIVLFIGVSAFFLFTTQEGTTTRIRDIFIIFMALESLVIGVALIILIAQVATLINLLQNEVRPILEATNETVKTLRGTTAFLGEHLAEPVIQLNSYLAGLQRLLEMVGLKKK